MRLAVLADVHGNLPSLEAVLADIEQQGVDGITVVSDFVDGPQPLETGRNVPGHLLDHFHTLSAQAGLGDQDVVPDSIWEQAIATFDWETGR